MKEELDLVKFNLTEEMAKELIRFNNLKKELMNLKKKEILKNSDLIKLNELESKLSEIRISFIKEFRKNNKEEIIRYLQLKDQEN